MIRGRIRLLLLIGALALTVIAVFRPSLPAEREVFHYLFVVDVTRSMNVPDYLLNGEPISRLELTRRSLQRFLREVPCDSKVGIALFSGWQTGLLLNPVEACGHRQELTELVSDIDWTLGWVPQSNVRRALVDGMAHQRRMESPPTLVFISDGDEAPAFGGAGGWTGASVPELAAPVILVGTGSEEASNVPRLDPRGQSTGFLSLPSGAAAVSRLDEEHLVGLAAEPDISYLRLRDDEQLVTDLLGPEHATRLPGERPLAPLFAGLALLLLVAVHVPALVNRGPRP
ncbi:VWA domain-containing protein [Methylonatrum kenyense]|uniref:vWA domain-containing protein n=1 Tax=Methylonatrum kenyense TaxID=455253 RepID=UPI0020C091BE|nr:vWA domain-containing protein [Methylonatrum kenyense]MCK8516597.1 VWA domain-containing protein [Methylonatrum kenyense]